MHEFFVVSNFYERSESQKSRALAECMLEVKSWTKALFLEVYLSWVWTIEKSDGG